MIIILIISVVAIALYLLKLNYQYWEKRGVPGPKPKFLVGNIGSTFSFKKSSLEIYSQIYKEYKHFPLVGIYRACTPSVLICDPELIKEVTVKSFNHFHDNDIEVDKKVDPLFGRSPFCLRGEEWKTVRNQLTPAFTSGKMKWLFPHLEDMSEQLVKFIERQPQALNGEGYEAKELCIRFTLNNVACCAFGLEGKCFEEENSEFRQMAKEFLTPGTWKSILFFIAFVVPILTKIISLKFVKKEVEQKLKNIVSQTLKYREENNIIRNDFLHILQQLKKTCREYEFTDVDVTAHAAGFFGDGSETTSIVMSFLLFELAANPEVQSKLREEISQHSKENGNKLSYEVIQSLPYLDGVVNEALRMHPATFSLHKLCTKPYTYVPKGNDGITKPVVIEKGTTIILPLYGLHHDPQYFENPETFTPERFVGANKENLTKYAFLPFGEGPRACLGKRFGILQVKVGVAYIIQNYEISVNKKTKVPIQYDPLSFLASAVGGLWLDFKRIK